MRTLLFILLFASASALDLGIDRLFEEGSPPELEGKRVGLITNQTGVDSKLRSTIDIFRENAGSYTLVALFGPEHGIDGSVHAEKKIDHKMGDIPVYSLYGETRRPTAEMLKGIDVLVYDIQDVGMRCYTYASTLFYAMEEAAKHGIEVIVLDRPNPINGTTVDGPMLDPKWRSFVGYIDVPICHGMTIGELARYFNDQYSVDCKLKVIRMKGWERSMSFADTGLQWVPTSPHIPEATTPLYYSATALMGDLLTEINIGVGYTLPFKIVGAPWIDGPKLAAALNEQNFKGITFQPFTFCPFFGRFKGEECQGVRLVVTDSTLFRPVSTQFLMMGVLKSLYPDHFQTSTRRDYLCKIYGSEEIFDIIDNERFIAWKLIGYQKDERRAFLQKRKHYLLY